MTKLIIQIPCWNEEGSLGATLDALPREIPGVDKVETLIIDDGSTDRTVEIARAHGVDHVVTLSNHQGLARGFMAGIEACLAAGADVIVNTDADNQYQADDIAALVEPVLEERAGIVVGARPMGEESGFSRSKRALQRLGSWVVRVLSGTDVPDAPSGFRAFSRDAAMRLNVFTDFSYTLETIIEAGRRGIPITSVPVRTNPAVRPSRLASSTSYYVLRSTLAILRIFMFYSPLRSFAALGAVPFAAGLFLGLRWIVLFFEDPTRTHVPSLILTAILLLVGCLCWALGLVGDLQAVNRKLLEDIQVKAREAAYGRPGGTSEGKGS